MIYLASADEITAFHIAEVLQYRTARVDGLILWIVS